MVSATLVESLKRLCLSGMAQTLGVRLEEAAANRLNHAEFLELALQDELTIRHERLIARRTKAASFREQKTLEDFDWEFNRTIKKKQIFDLAAGRFVREKRDVLWCGPPGVGKSHLAQAVGLKLVQARYTVLYRSIFDAVRGHVARRGLRGPRQGDGQVSQGGLTDPRRHGHEAVTQAEWRISVRDHHAPA
jgi:DNA replication protein DnaC